VAHLLKGQTEFESPDDELNQIVLLIKGKWRQAMRTRYRPAGEWIASQAPRIELFIRYQQAKSVLQDTDSMSELAKAMTSALFQAAAGNWHLIAVGDEYANRVTVDRRKRVIRRATVIGISIVGAIAAARFMRHFPPLYVQGIIYTCLGLGAIELFAIIDPDIAARLDIANKIASMIKH
jgi:hypothetical protein